MPSGRTDKGVHARMQVVSLKISTKMGAVELKEQLNARLHPMQLGFSQLLPLQYKFHAQWQCLAKEYRYRLAYTAPPSDWNDFVWMPEFEPRFENRKLPAPEAIAQVLQSAVGTRDFSAFHEKSSVIKERSLFSAKMSELGKGVFEICLRGNSFARYQVRYLVGSAVAVAQGLIPYEQWLSALSHARPLNGLKAPAKGLVLWEVFYSDPGDPFNADMRAKAYGVPSCPPFTSPLLT